MFMKKLKQRFNKDGSPDKRFKKKKSVEEILKDPKVESVTTNTEGATYVSVRPSDPNELHEQLLKDNNLKLDFDVLEGTVTTKHGIIKLDKPTLVIKASYVRD